jgi:CRP/FNR family transcriptional regulator, cyclic AMP receptor protein
VHVQGRVARPVEPDRLANGGVGDEMLATASHVEDRRMADEGVERALAASHLGTLPAETLARLTAGSRRVRLEPGSVRHREGDPQPHLDVVVSGFARVFVMAPDGRTMTVRYCRPGAILGAVSLFSRPFRMPATVQCLLPTDFLALDPRVVRELADSDPRVAGALLAELSERVSRFIAEIPQGAFATVRERVARHLLDLASES